MANFTLVWNQFMLWSPMIGMTAIPLKQTLSITYAKLMLNDINSLTEHTLIEPVFAGGKYNLWYYDAVFVALAQPDVVMYVGPYTGGDDCQMTLTYSVVEKVSIANSYCTETKFRSQFSLKELVGIDIRMTIYKYHTLFTEFDDEAFKAAFTAFRHYRWARVNAIWDSQLSSQETRSEYLKLRGEIEVQNLLQDAQADASLMIESIFSYGRIVQIKTFDPWFVGKILDTVVGAQLQVIFDRASQQLQEVRFFKSGYPDVKSAMILMVADDINQTAAAEFWTDFSTLPLTDLYTSTLNEIYGSKVSLPCYENTLGYCGDFGGAKSINTSWFFDPNNKAVPSWYDNVENQMKLGKDTTMNAWVLTTDAVRFVFEKLIADKAPFDDATTVTNAFRSISGLKIAGQTLDMTTSGVEDNYRSVKTCLTLLEVPDGADPVSTLSFGRCAMVLTSTTVISTIPINFEDGSSDVSSYFAPLKPSFQVTKVTATSISIRWSVEAYLSSAPLLRVDLLIEGPSSSSTLEFTPTSNETFVEYTAILGDLEPFTAYDLSLRVVTEAGDAVSEHSSWSTAAAKCHVGSVATVAKPATGGIWECVELHDFTSVRCNSVTLACECTTSFVEMKGFRSCPQLDPTFKPCNADERSCINSGGECDLGSGRCLCGVGYGTDREYLTTAADGLTCEELFTPCSQQGCLGELGTCDERSGICACLKTGTSLSAIQTTSSEDPLVEQLTRVYAAEGVVPDAWRLCVLDIASSDDQRKFWAISLWLSAWGVLSTLWVMWEMLFNTQLKHPNTMMQAFVAFAFPDFALSLINFVFFIDCLVDGDPLGDVSGTGGRSDAGCLVVSFLMYAVVIMTYFAPVNVALLTFMKFRAVAAGKASWALPNAVVYGICIVFPLIVGAALAGGALASTTDDGYSPLGSYRGLYCYVRRWDDATTGTCILLMFCICTFSTLLFYVATTAKVAAIVKNASGSGSSKAPKAIMKRGLMLTATFIGTWIWFVTVGGMASANSTIDINIDMIGAIILNAQPIIDGCILLTLPNIRIDYLSRWLKQAGGSVSSSSSSSSSSS